MGSLGTTIQPVYISLLSDISGNQPSSQSSEAPLGFFSQFMNEAVANSAAASSQTASSSAETAPNTLQIPFDTTPGPLYGRPIAPEGSSEIGQWAVLPDGSYFSASDVNADGVATLTAPPPDWQSTPAGETLTASAGIPADANAAILPAPASAAVAAAPNTIQVQFDTNPGPLYGRPIAPEGSFETGQWAILPDGSYFSASDVNASGVATLTAPPAGWQSTPAGQTLTSLETLLGAIS